MFEVERFVEDCKQASTESDGRAAVNELLTRSLADSPAVLKALGEPKKALVEKLYHSDDLTILHLLWGPHMTLMPHDHRMWAVIGIYTGAEDNIFWRREDGGLRAAGARALRVGDVAQLGPEVIHSVTNPVTKLTGAIHVYGGDFFAAHRSEWDPQTFEELPYDVDKNMRLFEECNARLEVA